MLKTFFVFASASMLLAGCSFHYAKKGASQQDLSHDWTNCQAKAGQAGLAGNETFLDNCMVGEGWRRK